MKAVEKRTQLLNDLRNRRYELKDEAEDRKRWEQQFTTQGRIKNYLPQVHEHANK